MSIHDIGGKVFDSNNEINISDPPLTHWEKGIHALLVILSTFKPSALLTTDELRRTVENLEPIAYHNWDYYSKWAVCITQLLIERAVITETELYVELYGENQIESPQASFKVGDKVRMKSEDERIRWRKPHLRCPGYIFGLNGVIERVVGAFEDPYLIAFRANGPKQYLYRVSFRRHDIWASNYYSIDEPDASVEDRVVVDVYEPWLQQVTSADGESASSDPPSKKIKINEHRASSHEHSHDHDHDHSHSHDHVHLQRAEIERNAVQSEGEESPGHLVGNALFRLLNKKGLISKEQIAATIDRLDSYGQRLAGADLVVAAWLDPAFKARLLLDASAPAVELGISVSNPNAPTVLIIVENTATVHNLVVCTLCSCYPGSVLGISPAWYKSRNYRARAVREPRKVLKEFGTELPTDVSIVVHDSTADCRYMVLPLRPEGTEGWSKEQLRAIVTRDSMIGVCILRV